MKLCTIFLLAALPVQLSLGEGIQPADIAAPVQEVLQTFEPTTLEDCAALAIGAPELMRYSMVSDFIETEILELSYVDHGLDYADFSIGQFQMKPSFVERLEAEICNHALLKLQYQELTEYPNDEVQAIRAERLKRIKSDRYQQLIMKAFFDYCRLVYCDYLDQLPLPEVVGFIGTTYNMGFDRQVNQVLDYQSLRRFPYGARYTGEQHAYGALSTAIFTQLIKSLCKSTYSTSSQDCYAGPVRNNCPW